MRVWIGPEGLPCIEDQGDSRIWSESLMGRFAGNPSTETIRVVITPFVTPVPQEPVKMQGFVPEAYL